MIKNCTSGPRLIRKVIPSLYCNIMITLRTLIPVSQAMDINLTPHCVVGEVASSLSLIAVYRGIYSVYVDDVVYVYDAVIVRHYIYTIYYL